MASRSISPIGRVLIGLTAVSAMLVAMAAPVAAHAHYASSGQAGDGQILANGQLHGAFVNGVSCGGDPAAYGLETAHHGPDAGAPGRADGCYMTTGGVAPGADVSSPEIR
ncbi:MAG: hypothetical protein ABIV26_05175 [Candidatus Limnocylindrales bacterium]